MKAVIPAAGLGTRMLPATKGQPKEMLPVVDRPAIQWVVEEAVQSGCDEVIIVTGPSKRAIEEHFGPAPTLRRILESKNKKEALAHVDGVESLGRRVRFVEQAEPLGLGHAVLTARRAVGDAPFAVLLGDDLLVGPGRPATRRLIDVHAAKGGSALLVQDVPRSETRRYGVIDPAAAGDLGGDALYKVRAIVEKPDPAEAPSTLAAVGRYLLTPAVFPALEAVRPDANGEIQLTDALQTLVAGEGVHALSYGGRRHDVGSLSGWRAANAELAPSDRA